MRERERERENEDTNQLEGIVTFSIYMDGSTFKNNCVQKPRNSLNIQDLHKIIKEAKINNMEG